MRIGFEIEVEDVVGVYGGIPGIQLVTDNSLRNGIEVVSDSLADEDFAKALYNYMYCRMSGVDADRCGFHCHMDFSDKTPEFLSKFLER